MDLKEILRKIPSDFPITQRPYKEIAKKAGLTEEEILDSLRVMKEKGMLRRVAAILSHRKVSYNWNGMVVWRVPEEEVEEKGRIMASHKNVSHCYERESSDFWDYNLYTMVHAKTKREFLEVVRELTRLTGIEDYKIFLSKREFKKVGLSLRDE